MITPNDWYDKAKTIPDYTNTCIKESIYVADGYGECWCKDCPGEFKPKKLLWSDLN